MVNSIQFIQDEFEDTGELPPPYAVLDDQDGGSESSNEAPESIQMLHPTDMTMVFNNNTATARQLLRPKQKSIKIQFEGFSKTSLTIRPDIDDKYQGLILVHADFEYQDGGPLQQNLSLSCISEVEEKSEQLQITFCLCTEHDSVCKNVACVCEMIIPINAAASSEEDVLSKLIVKMPRNSQLLVRNIPSSALGSLDTAVIQGSTDIQNVSISDMRVAIGEGAICAHNVFAANTADFVSIFGSIELRNCAAVKTLGVKTKSASIDIDTAKASQVVINGGARPIQARSIEADSLRVQSGSGGVTVECTVADLQIATRSGSIHGTWNVSRTLDICAASAIIKGAFRILSDCVRASVRSRDWPICLAMDERYVGHYNVRARNSVVRFGLPRGTRYEDHPHWCHGVIGVGANVLNIEGINAPVVVSSLTL